MRVIKKETGRRAKVVEIENDLKPLQDAVGGWIECVHIPGLNDVCIICDEEGVIKGLPFNTDINGLWLFGPILIVGTDGEEFCDVPDKYVPQLLRAL